MLVLVSGKRITGMVLVAFFILFQAAFAETSTPETASKTDAEILKSAKQLVQQGESEQAYKLLIPLEEAYSGEPAYDYLLGVAALDSGNASYAVFALQRALVVNTKFVGAKIDLGRAYFKLGEFDNAEKEFQSVLAAKPSPKVTSFINDYITRIKQGNPARNKYTLQLYIDNSAGYSSNANSATELESFLGLDLLDINRKSPSLFSSTGAGMNYSYAILPAISMVGVMNVHRRAYEQTSFIDSTAIDGSLSLRGLYGKHLLNLTSGYFRSYIDRNYSGDNKNGMLSWMWMLTKQFNITSFYQFSMIRAAIPDSPTDTNTHTAVMSASLASELSFIPNINVSLVGSKAIAEVAASPYGRLMNGVQFSLSKSLKNAYSPVFALSGRAFINEYDGLFNGFVRSDVQKGISAQITLVPISSITTGITVGYSQNTSTVSLFSYSGFEATLNVRWAFDK